MTEDEFDELLGKLSELDDDQRKMASAQLALTRTRKPRPRALGDDLETRDPSLLIWQCAQRVSDAQGLSMVFINPTRPQDHEVPAVWAERYDVVTRRLVDYVEHYVQPRDFSEKWRALYKVVTACYHNIPFPKKRVITMAMLTERLEEFEAAVANQYPHYAAAGQLRFALL